MQDMVLVLSRCQAMRYSPKSGRKYFRFHFKGFFKGLKIKEIWLNAHQDICLQKGEDYLLWVKPREVKDSILVVHLIKYKKIE